MKHQKAKDKKKKAAREKDTERLTGNFSIAIMKTKKRRNETFNVLEENNCLTKLLYLTKRSPINDNETKKFSGKLRVHHKN